MPTEILVLALGVVLLIVHIALQGLTATSELGLAWNAGPRDENLAPRGAIAGRAARALRNYLETFPALVALALALVVTEKAGGLGAAGAWIWLTGRLVFIPLYLLGVSYVRSLAWVASVLGLTLMLVALFL